MSWWFGRGVESRAEAASNSAALMKMADLLVQQLRDERAESRRLTDTIVELKRDGFHPPGAVDQVQPVDLTVPDAIELAIRQRAPKGSELEGELRRWSLEMLRGNRSEEEVAKMILRGGGDDDGGE